MKRIATVIQKLDLNAEEYDDVQYFDDFEVVKTLRTEKKCTLKGKRV